VQEGRGVAAVEVAHQPVDGQHPRLIGREADRQEAVVRLGPGVVLVGRLAGRADARRGGGAVVTVGDREPPLGLETGRESFDCRAARAAPAAGSRRRPLPAGPAG
jgi:hypothetical protein